MRRKPSRFWTACREEPLRTPPVPSRGLAIRKRIDPELLRQLDEAESGEGAAKDRVQAVFVLSDVERSPDSVTPESTQAAVDRIVARLGKRGGQRIQRINVFKNLGSFVVQAPAGVVRSLLDDPEIGSARANRPSSGPSKSGS